MHNYLLHKYVNSNNYAVRSIHNGKYKCRLIPLYRIFSMVTLAIVITVLVPMESLPDVPQHVPETHHKSAVADGQTASTKFIQVKSKI